MNWQVLDLQPSPQSDQLEHITRQLYQLVFAIDALLESDVETWATAAADLELTPILSDWLEQRQQGGYNSLLNPDEARSLVLMICHLAQQNHALIRRGVNLVEQFTQQNRPLTEVTLLRDYLAGFRQRYQQFVNSDSGLSAEQITSLALKSLIDLLFYSQPNSPQPFWLALVT
ncbi:MAG: DUF3038 domain-containing protein [Microcoleaceae cyanobacterium]